MDVCVSVCVCACTHTEIGSTATVFASAVAWWQLFDTTVSNEVDRFRWRPELFCPTLPHTAPHSGNKCGKKQKNCDVLCVPWKDLSMRMKSCVAVGSELTVKCCISEQMVVSWISGGAVVLSRHRVFVALLPPKGFDTKLQRIITRGKRVGCAVLNWTAVFRRHKHKWFGDLQSTPPHTPGPRCYSCCPLLLFPHLHHNHHGRTTRRDNGYWNCWNCWGGAEQPLIGKRAKNGGGWEDEGDSECWGGVVDVAVLLNFNEHQGEFILHIFF